MTVRRPLVLLSGQPAEIPSADNTPQMEAQREPTGFDDPTSVTVSYDSTTQVVTITQTGGVVYWYRGSKFTAASPWTSSSHTATTGLWFLSFGAAGTLSWSMTIWDLSAAAPVCAVSYNTPAGVHIGVRESHGLMPWQVHQELHERVGTYRRSGGDPTAGTYALNTDTNAAITPGFDVAVVADEDLPSTIALLTEGSYTHLRIAAGSAVAFRTAQSYLTYTTGTYPRVNNPSTGAETEVANGDFFNVYQIMIPATADAASQVYRMVFMQPQEVFASLALAQAEDVGALSKGNLASLYQEFCIYTRLTFQAQAANTTVGKVRLMGLSYITDSRSGSSGGGTPAHAPTHYPAGSDALPWTTIHGRGLAAARPVAAASNAGYIYFSTDTQVLERSTGAAWENIGSAGTVTLATDREVNAAEPPASSDSRLRNPFAFNYITNPDAEMNTTGWVTYADAAGVQPVDGVSGSPVVTWTRSSTLILRGTNSFVLAKDGSNRQGQGVSYDFTIDQGDLNTSMTVAFDCKPLTSAYVAKDISVWVYNTTTGTLCPISGSNYVSAGGKFVAQFSVAANYSYRLIIHVSGTTAAAWDMFFDNFYVGPVYLPSAPAMSDWQDGGAITITATTTNPTKGTTAVDKVRWRRVGDSAEIEYEFAMSAAGSAGSGDYLLALPAGMSFASGVTFNTDTEVTATKSALGSGGITNGTARGWASAVPYDATRVRILGTVHYASQGILGSAYYQFSATTAFRVKFSVPIAGWSGSTAVQPGSRYLWAQRFAANAVRVTAAPTQPGQYRARNGTTDTAPTTGPAQGGGLRIHSNPAAGQINWYDIYVGPGKIVRWSVWQNTGRTTPIDKSIHYIVPAGTNMLQGCVCLYDPVSGVASIWTANNGAGRESLGLLPQGVEPTSGYCDILVADDPVPVALAPAVHVEASSDAGQSLTADVTDAQYEDEAVDTHGAWSGTVFTAPVAGRYLVVAAFDTVGGYLVRAWVNGVALNRSGTSASSTHPRVLVDVMSLKAGDTVRFRASEASGARSTEAVDNYLRITRVGDV